MRSARACADATCGTLEDSDAALDVEDFDAGAGLEPPASFQCNSPALSRRRMFAVVQVCA